MMHKFGTSTNYYFNNFKHYFREIPSITMELLLMDDFLENNEHLSSDIISYKYNRLAASFTSAAGIIFQKALLNIYKTNGCVTEEKIIEYLNSLDKKSILYQILSTEWSKYLNRIIVTREPLSIKGQKYVLGTLLASVVHQKIKTEKNNLNYLFKLINSTEDNDCNYSNLTSLLGIPIVKGKEIKMMKNFKNMIVESYKDEFNNIIDSKNSNDFPHYAKK